MFVSILLNLCCVPNNFILRRNSTASMTKQDVELIKKSTTQTFQCNFEFDSMQKIDNFFLNCPVFHLFPAIHCVLVHSSLSLHKVKKWASCNSPIFTCAVLNTLLGWHIKVLEQFLYFYQRKTLFYYQKFFWKSG